MCTIVDSTAITTCTYWRTEEYCCERTGHATINLGITRDTSGIVEINPVYEVEAHDLVVLGQWLNIELVCTYIEDLGEVP